MDVLTNPLVYFGELETKEASHAVSGKPLFINPPID